MLTHKPACRLWAYTVLTATTGMLGASAVDADNSGVIVLGSASVTMIRRSWPRALAENEG